MVTTTGPDRTYAGRTGEDRAAGRRTQLIEAALELVGTEGAAALTMRAAARTASLSPRYFYESFADRDELLLAAFDHALELMRSGVLEGFAPTGTVRDGIDAAAALIERDPRVGRILFREAFADGVLREHAVDLVPNFFLVALSQASDSTLSTTKLPLQLSALAGALINLFLEWTEGRLGTDRAEFADYCTDVIHRLTAP